MFSFGLNFEVGSNPATELSHYRDKECIGAGRAVILPFLGSLKSRGYAAILSFWAGVIPPIPMLGRSLL